MSSVNQPILAVRIVYATITIMSLLIMYDGWQRPRLVDAIGVIVLVVAMIVAEALPYMFRAITVPDTRP